MKKYLHIYWLFSKNSFKIAFQNRTGVILFTLGKIIRFVIFFVFISQILSRTKLLAGYTLTETLIFFLTYNLVDTVAQLFFREVYRFRPLVINGGLDSVLIKPYPSLLRVLLGGLDIMDIFMLIPYTALLLFYLQQITVINIVSFTVYSLLFTNAIFIAAAFHILVLALGVLTTEIDHAIMIYRDVTRMASVPVEIYKEPLQSLFTFIIPIGIMMTFPVKALFQDLSLNLILISFIIGLTTFSFSLITWNIALKKYQSWGG